MLCLCSFSSSAQQRLRYHVSLDTVGHYLNVNLQYVAEKPADTLRLYMPVWAPGYYLIIDYPKNLTDFAASDQHGTMLAWQKEGKSCWKVLSRGADTIKVSYRIYADSRSVAESRVENGMAFVAPNGVFMYPEGQKSQSVEVSYSLPANWTHISTGLKRVAGADAVFLAPDFDVLYDSPLLLGNHTVKTFRQDGHDYEMALLAPDGVDETPFVADVKRMMTAASSLMGDIPYDNYCFILLDEGQGGLEHCNSMADYTSGTFRFASQDEYLRTMAFVTHEYFHLYNVKRIRPIELGPFDYEHEVFTPMLWVSEGFTVYYEHKIMQRAGIVGPDYVLRALSEPLRTVEGNEGHRHMSLRQSSYDIWLNFFNRNANGAATRISYYDKGPILGLLMDIEILRLTHGQKSLDDVMRTLYNTYYKQLGRGFTEEEFWQTCTTVAGSPLTLMRHYVDTTDEIDYDKCLFPAGLGLDRATWTLHRLAHPGKEQLKIRKQIIGE